MKHVSRRTTILALAPIAAVLIVATGANALRAEKAHEHTQVGERVLPDSVSEDEYREGVEVFEGCLLDAGFLVRSDDDASESIVIVETSFAVEAADNLEPQLENMDRLYDSCYSPFAAVDERYQLQQEDRIEAFYETLDACVQERETVSNSAPIGLSFEDDYADRPAVLECLATN